MRRRINVPKRHDDLEEEEEDASPGESTVDSTTTTNDPTKHSRQRFLYVWKPNRMKIIIVFAFLGSCVLWYHYHANVHATIRLMTDAWWWMFRWGKSRWNGPAITSRKQENRSWLLFGNVTAVREYYESLGMTMKQSLSLSPNNNVVEAIFYNIYIPSSHHPGQISHAKRIIQEQFQQMLMTRRNFTVFYNVIIQSSIQDVLLEDMVILCQQYPNLNCHFLRSYENATEAVTLQNLYDYCVKHVHDRVIYLHSKGSFHDNTVNAAWRRALTAAALACQSCDVCGLQFFTQFTLFFPGNMWSADCRYVAKLLPPASSSYKERREMAVQEFLLRRITGHMKSQLLRDRIDYFGLDRYNSEHWIGSHPHIQPCDMDPAESLNEVFRRDASIDTVTDHFQWSRAPRHAGFAVGNVWTAHERLQNSTSERLQEYFLLAGHVLKWGILYQEFPKNNSWVWKWFPDGDTWKNAVHSYGIRAVDILTQQYSYREDGDQNSEEFRQKQHFSMNTTNIWQTIPGATPTPSVFYHIDLSKGMDKSFDKVQMQFDIISNSISDASHPVTVYFNVVGSSDVNATTRVQRYCSKHKMLDCVQMFQFDEIFEGETLRQLYLFCSTANHSNHRVVYISNACRFPMQQGSNQNRLLRHMTMAASNKLCLNPIQNTCNACGLIFFTLGVISFAGNMFATSCQYVNKLHDPAIFETHMHNTFGRFLLSTLRHHITSNIFPDQIFFHGVTQYAHEHWIASHPFLRPCDLSASFQGLDFWVNHDRTPIDFAWSMAPRHSGSLFAYNATKKHLVFANESLRIREYSLLAGNILKWHYIYGEIPPHDSWVWSWFPDGLTWRNGVAAFDTFVFEKMNKNFVD
jgi:hypothetical protein